MRKLVTVKIVDEIIPIEGADFIEEAVIGGWSVIVKKGDFRPNETGLFFEIDSFLPLSDPRFNFLVSKAITYQGINGVRIKTMKMKGVLSQGLLLKISDFEEVSSQSMFDFDFSEILGVTKYEKLDKILSAEAKGNFPNFIPKTDQERCENLNRELFGDKSLQNRNSDFEVTMKLDGSSITIYNFEGVRGVCSRNLELKIDEPSTFVDTAKSCKLFENVPDGYAIQGEIMGPGIQGNRENFSDFKIFIFDVYDINNKRYLSFSERYDFLRNFPFGMDNHVPVLRHDKIPQSMSEIKAMSEIASVNSHVGEGIVFKREDGKFSFKSINNKFLLKDK
jgi:RNA ligase (TIGR02306 family)